MLFSKLAENEARHLLQFKFLTLDLLQHARREKIRLNFLLTSVWFNPRSWFLSGALRELG